MKVSSLESSSLCLSLSLSKLKYKQYLFIVDLKSNLI